jgi:ubiquinone/menaquinone biosynthesis C-methylase UbiE
VGRLPSQHDLREFLVGIQGLAILRHWGTDAAAVAARAADAARLAAGPPVPTDSAMVAFHEVPVGQGYAAIAADYDTTPNVIVDTEHAAVRGLLERLPLGRALDAACGTGRHAAWLAGRGHRVLGVDQSAAMLSVAAGKLAAEPRVTLALGDLERLPLAAGAVDLTVCALALAHLADPTAAIVELGRVTRPGGRVVLSDVHPLMATLGYHAFHRSADGTRALVRNHAHLHATYVAAFRLAGLTVRGCLEPCWTEAAVAAQRWAAPVPEAARQALVGLPTVLVWELVRADGGTGYARR